MEPGVLIANLPDGDKLAYLDSGPVPNSDDFTTLILLHGMCFNAYGFEHLLPLAHKFNLRLVFPQRKDYVGSSEYTDAEMAALTENPRVFFQSAGRTLARFVFYLIKHTHVCKPGGDYSRGGIGIAGWSFGAPYAMAMFAGRGMLDDPTYSTIMPYVTALILYDPPYHAFGMSFPVVTVPPDAAFDDIKEVIQLLASSYYDQPAQWDGQLSTLDMRLRTDRCSITSWTRAQQERWTEDFPIRSEMPVITNTLTLSYLEELATEVLFNFDVNSSPFPRARVTYLYAKRTMWHVVAARYKIWDKQMAFLKQGLGNRLRPTRFKDVEWANHFLHFDYPQEFMMILGDCLHQEHRRHMKDKVHGVDNFSVQHTNVVPWSKAEEMTSFSFPFFFSHLFWSLRLYLRQIFSWFTL